MKKLELVNITNQGIIKSHNELKNWLVYACQENDVLCERTIKKAILFLEKNDLTETLEMNELISNLLFLRPFSFDYNVRGYIISFEKRLNNILQLPIGYNI